MDVLGFHSYLCVLDHWFLRVGTKHVLHRKIYIKNEEIHHNWHTYKVESKGIVYTYVIFRIYFFFIFWGKCCLNVWSVVRRSMILHLSSVRGHDIDHPKKLLKSSTIVKTYMSNKKQGYKYKKTMHEVNVKQHFP